MRSILICGALLICILTVPGFGDKVDLEMDVTGQLDMTGFGTDLYPGANLSHFAVHGDDEKTNWTLIFTTSDPINKVIEFYRYRLSKPLEENTSAAERSARWETGLPQGTGTLTVEISRDGDKGKTMITMIRKEH
jgi:hypothetical protein